MKLKLGIYYVGLYVMDQRIQKMGSQSGTNKVASLVVEAKTKQVNSELEKSLSYTQCKLTSPFEFVKLA